MTDRREFIKACLGIAAGAACPPAVAAIASTFEKHVGEQLGQPICWLDVDGVGFKGRVPLTNPARVYRLGQTLCLEFAKMTWDGTWGRASVVIETWRGTRGRTMILDSGDYLVVTFHLTVDGPMMPAMGLRPPEPEAG